MVLTFTIQDKYAFIQLTNVAISNPAHATKIIDYVYYI